MAVGEVLYVRELLGQHIFNFWLLFTFFDLEVSLLPVIFFRQFFMHGKVSFEDNEYLLALIPFSEHVLPFHILDFLELPVEVHDTIAREIGENGQISQKRDPRLVNSLRNLHQ